MSFGFRKHYSAETTEATEGGIGPLFHHHGLQCITGSVLAPLLFRLNVNDLPYVYLWGLFIVYMDDVIICIHV